MPILKTEILGSIFEINYEEKEKIKLHQVIEKFNKRLLDFKNLEGKVSDNKILLLAALKSEDQVIDLINKLSKKQKEEEDNKVYVSDMNNLKQEIIRLKDHISELNIENKELKNLNSKAFNELNKIEEKMKTLIDSIIDQNQDDN